MLELAFGSLCFIAGFALRGVLHGIARLLENRW